VREEARWVLIGLQKPCPAILEVAEKFPIILGVHLAGPDYLGVVDVGVVVDVLTEVVMIG
jgi:hypothetical protein